MNITNSNPPINTTTFQSRNTINRPLKSLLQAKELVRANKLNSEIDSTIEARDIIYNALKLYETSFINKELTKEIQNILKSTNTKMQALIKSSIIREIIAHKTLNQNTSLKKYLANILKDTNNKDEYNAKMIILNKYTENEDSNETLMDQIKTLVRNIINRTNTESNKYKNKSVASILGYTLYRTKTPEEAHAKMDLLDKIINSPEIFNDKHIKKHLSTIINSTSTEEQTKSKILLIDNFNSNKEVSENEIIKNLIPYIIQNSNNAEVAKAQNSIINTYASSKLLQKNESLNDDLSFIIELTTPENLEKTSSIMTHFATGKYEHTQIPQLLGSIITRANSKKEATFILSMADKIANNTALYKNQNILDNLEEIITSTTTHEKLEARTKIIDTFNKTPFLCENPYVLKQIGTIIKNCDSMIASKIQTEYLNKYASSAKFYKNKDISCNLHKILQNKVQEYKKYFNM